MRQLITQTFSLAAWIASLATGVSAIAETPAPRPGLHLTTPADWKQQQEPATDAKKPAGIIITALPAQHLRMRIQPIPLGDKVLTDDVLQKLLANMAKPELGGQTMPDPVKVDGPASGFKVTFKPANQTSKDAVEVTDVIVQIPGLALAASITYRPESTALDTAVTIVKTATFGRPTKPAK